MASISIHFRNGDFIVLGCSLEMANLAYNAIVSTDDDFVVLGVLDNWPRFAIRRADVIAAVVDPNDTSTIYLSSAVVRSTEIRSKIPPPPVVPLPAAEQQATPPSTRQRPRPRSRLPETRNTGTRTTLLRPSWHTWLIAGFAFERFYELHSG